MLTQVLTSSILSSIKLCGNLTKIIDFLFLIVSTMSYRFVPCLSSDEIIKSLTAVIPTF